MRSRFGCTVYSHHCGLSLLNRTLHTTRCTYAPRCLPRITGYNSNNFGVLLQATYKCGHCQYTIVSMHHCVSTTGGWHLCCYQPVFTVVAVVAVSCYLSVITLDVACPPQKNARYSQHCCHPPCLVANHLSFLGVAAWSCSYHSYHCLWSSLYWHVWLNSHCQLCSDYKAVALFCG